MNEFFYMGGFGFYVWMSMGATFILMAGEIFWLRKQRKNTLKQIARLNRIDKRKAEGKDV
jgi:heme exporter protein D